MIIPLTVFTAGKNIGPYSITIIIANTMKKVIEDSRD